LCSGRVDSVNAVSNGGNGIRAGGCAPGTADPFLVNNATAARNGVTGIRGSASSTVTGSTAELNFGSQIIAVGIAGHNICNSSPCS